MKVFASAALAASALSLSTPAFSATDSGLQLHGDCSGAVVRTSGMGVEAGVTLRFGNRKMVKESDRLRLNMSAGPVMRFATSQTAGPKRRVVGGLLSFDVRPGYASTFAVAGQKIAIDYTALGAAEAAKADKMDGDSPKKKRSTVKTVLLVAGGVAVVGFLGVVAVYGIQCGNGQCSE